MAPHEVLADIGHDHGRGGSWVNKGDVCAFCTCRMRGERARFINRVNAYSRAIQRARVEVGVSMADGGNPDHAQRYLRDLRDGRREVQRALAAYDVAIEQKNERVR